MPAMKGTRIWAWLAFATVVVALLVFDLGVLHRKEREIPVGESLLLSAGYIAVAQAEGIYADHDLDVTLVEGRGSSVAAQLVATGQVAVEVRSGQDEDGGAVGVRRFECRERGG